MEYAGDITVEQAWSMLESEPGARLVDVRTIGEWQQVGIPAAPEGTPAAVFVEWVDATGAPNPSFVDQVVAECADTAAPIVFLCRSGRRSIGAATALTAAGYDRAYNILAGFEAPGGWRDTGLPEA